MRLSLSQCHVTRGRELLLFSDVVDEMYNEVKYVEPFVPGGRSSPSTAFCLLFKVTS